MICVTSSWINCLDVMPEATLSTNTGLKRWFWCWLQPGGEVSVLDEVLLRD